MKRVGISGTNWTGKTTTLRAIQSEVGDRAQLVSLSEYVSKCPHPMIEEQVPAASRWMVEQLNARLRAPDHCAIELYDRTPIDILAFTQYSFDRLGLTEEASLVSDIARLLNSFDCFFFVSPSEEWPVSVRPPPAKIGFALLMHWYMRRVIKDHAISVVELPWALDERHAIIMKDVAA